MTKFDGKDWVAKRRPKGHLKITDSKRFFRQSNESLGYGGIVAITNARPDEYRAEEFFKLAKSQYGRGVKEMGDGRVIYDSNAEIYVMKAQEINTKTRNGNKITLLAYNLPYETNLSDSSLEKTLEEASELKCILGITGPSCINTLTLEEEFEEVRNLLPKTDFFAVYSGSAFFDFESNEKAEDFYLEEIKGRQFQRSNEDKPHHIGAISVSGAHRTPWFHLIEGRATVGRCYTPIPDIYSLELEEFMDKLREGLRESKLENLRMKPIIAETIRHIGSIKIIDPIVYFIDRTFGNK
jgi:hypothetical protein